MLLTVSEVPHASGLIDVPFLRFLQPRSSTLLDGAVGFTGIEPTTDFRSQRNNLNAIIESSRAFHGLTEFLHDLINVKAGSFLARRKFAERLQELPH